jgi:hypothetical protein
LSGVADDYQGTTLESRGKPRQHGGRRAEALPQRLNLPHVHRKVVLATHGGRFPLIAADKTFPNPQFASGRAELTVSRGVIGLMWL